MKRIVLLVELEYDSKSWHTITETDSTRWFFNDILLAASHMKGELLLHSNEVGDSIGTVVVKKIVEEE